MQPLVSIGLCVRNGAEYLRGALDSLLAQTYKNFELVISDNASTDDTQKICEEYARRDGRIRYIRQRENIGSYGNYDFVRRESRGDYFAWAACDDFWERHFIEKCISKFREVPDAIMVFPNFVAFDDAGRILKLSPEHYFPFAHNAYERLKAYILYRAQYGKITMIYGLWKKRTKADLLSLGECNGDMIYMFRTLLTGYFANVDDVLFFKRGLVQLPLDPIKEAPSLRYLTTLPKTYKYESVDEWHKVRKQIEKNKSLKEKMKGFIANRLQMTRYFYLLSTYIFRASALTTSEKVRLFLWNSYAYLRSFRYGYL